MRRNKYTRRGIKIHLYTRIPICHLAKIAQIHFAMQELDTKKKNPLEKKRE